MLALGDALTDTLGLADTDEDTLALGDALTDADGVLDGDALTLVLGEVDALDRSTPPPELSRSM